jgi:hypothetical protein
LGTHPVPETGLLTSRWFLIAVVEAELLLGLVLVFGIFQRPVWGATIAFFGGASIVSLYKALSGEESCGCFGAVEANPAWAFLLDVAAITFLFICPPRVDGRTGYAQRARALSFGTVFVLVSLITVASTLSHAPTVDPAQGGLIATAGVTVLDPRAWIGQRFPLERHINVGEQLMNGEWTVIFFHHDCPRCQSLIEEQRAQVLRGMQLAVIEMPPFGTANHNSAPLGLPLLNGRLADDREWFAKTPLLMQLSGGIVTQPADSNIKIPTQSPSTLEPEKENSNATLRDVNDCLVLRFATARRDD